MIDRDQNQGFFPSKNAHPAFKAMTRGKYFSECPPKRAGKVLKIRSLREEFFHFGKNMFPIWYLCTAKNSSL